jgi:hypothetical protein
MTTIARVQRVAIAVKMKSLLFADKLVANLIAASEAFKLRHGFAA